MNDGAQLVNSGLLNFQSDAGVVRTAGAMSTLTNTGTLRKSAGAGTTAIGTGPLTFVNNGGTLDAQSGTLLFEGVQTFASGTTFSGNGTLAGTTAWTGGSIVGSLTVANDAIVNLMGADTKGLSNGAVLTNNGTMNLTGTGNLQLANNASLVNNGRFDIQGDAGIQNNASTPTTFVNAATLIKSAGTGVSTIGSNNQLTFTNAPSGIVIVQSGTLQANASFATSNGAPTNSGAIILLPNTTFSTNGAPLTNNGVIRGFGTFDLGGALFTNIGTVTPGASPGALTIGGDYTQGSNGTLVVELAGRQQGVTYDLLRVTGTANLGGTLHVLLGPGYVPAVGDTYSFVTYAQRTGDFANIVLPPGFGDAQPALTRYSVSSLLPLLVVATNSGASLGTNDVLALGSGQNINNENLEQVREGDDRMGKKGAVCQ